MNDKIKTVIIDNDLSAIGKLSDDLKSFPDIKLLDTATSIKKARSIIIALQPDLLFLGIEMPGMSGLDLLQEIRPDVHSGMRIIFYAAHDKYFRHVMLASDFDYYLLKPYLLEELATAIKRVRSRGERVPAEQLSHQIIRERRFALQTVTSIKILKYDEVLLFEFPKNMRHWQVRCLDPNRSYELRSTVTSKDILAISPNFIQINQHCIVNLTHISHIENKTLKCHLNDSSVEHYVSSRYFKELKTYLSIL